MRTLVASLLACALLGGCVSAKKVERATARRELGVAYYREGNTESAIATLRDAIELDPRSWRAWNSLAVAYIAKGQPKLAEKAFRKALRLNPGEGEILVTRGAFFVRNGRNPEAIADFRTALRDLDYRNPAAVLSNMSYALTESGKPAEGVEVAREAIRRAPQLCEARYHLGWALEHKGDSLGAMEAYKDQVTRCPSESLGSRLRLGCLQVQVGMFDEGQEFLRMVTTEAPATRFADEARACVAVAGARK